VFKEKVVLQTKASVTFRWPLGQSPSGGHWISHLQVAIGSVTFRWPLGQSPSGGHWVSHLQVATGPVFSSESIQYEPLYILPAEENRFTFRNVVLFREYETMDRTRNFEVASEMFFQKILELISSFRWMH
jgi:hypothetical protein